MVVQEVSPKEYYVSMKISEELSDGIKKLGTFTRELKKNRNSIYSQKMRRAEIRKEIYERLISLRLGLDKLKSLLPEHEAKMLENQLVKIKRHIRYEQKKLFKEKKKLLKEKQKVAKSGKCPVCHKNFKRLDLHKCKPPKKKEEEKKVEPLFTREEDLRLESEKQELENLRKDLENISREIEKHSKM
jgi:hypothetical protein